MMCLRISRVFECLVLLVVLVGTLAGVATAEESMWPLYDLDKVDFTALQDRGLELSAEEIYAGDGTGVASAIIQLGGGTAGFVSPEGLIVTNHHVAYGALQRASTVERNYVRDGFYARTRAEEIPAIGYNAYVTLAIDDVSERVLASITDAMTDRERGEAIERARKEILQQAEADGDVSCKIAEMFPGRQYVLYTRLKIRDIRIVYAPPRAIGNFGSEQDNWMWPRHTGDFSFVRAYVAPDGSPAPYDPANVPFKPIRYLPISAQGVKEGDISLMIGYPGRTSRYSSSYAIDQLINEYYPWYVSMSADRLAILEAAAAADSAVAVRLLSSIRGISNYYKKTKGTLYGSRRIDLLGSRQKLETELTAFLEAESAEEYLAVLPALDSLYREKTRTHKHDRTLRYLISDPDYLKLAHRVYEWAVERQKPELERKPGYQERYRDDARRSLEQAQINLLPGIDREALYYWLTHARALPDNQQIAGLQSLFPDGLEQASDAELRLVADSLVDQSTVGNLHARLAMFEMSAEDLEDLPDPALQLAIALKPELDAMEERTKEFDGALSRWQPLLQEAYAMWRPASFYPDANSTKRFNYGFVADYSPQDAVRFDMVTTLDGIMEKETGEFPFLVPAELKAAYAAGDYGPYADKATGQLPVNFLTTNVSTNGNSGSPILNGSGDMIGIVFDAAWWGVVADYQFDPRLSRAIHIDSRYMLFLIDRVYGLEELMAELTIK